MAFLEIPTRNDLPAYEQQVTLEGQTYTVQLYFNPRINDGAGKWLLTLADKNRNMLVGPMPITVNWPLVDRFFAEDNNSPPGTIFAFDTSGQNKDPGQFDLGSRVRLIYLESTTVV